MLIIEEDGIKVVLVDRLPPEVLGKVQALYARSADSMEDHLDSIYTEQAAALRAILGKHYVPSCIVTAPGVEHDREFLVDELQEFMDADGSSAAKFMDTYYVGYGHASIGDCSVGCVLGVEGISELACKALQHHPLFSGQQTSTRAVNVGAQPFRDPLGTTTSRLVIDRWVGFYTRSQAAVAEEVRRRHPRQLDESEKLYESAVKMRVFDIMRGFIPAGLVTQTSLAMNLRQLSDHLRPLLHHPLEEVRRVARLIQRALRERYPGSGSFGGGAALSGVGTKGLTSEEALALDAWVAATAADHACQAPCVHCPSFNMDNFYDSLLPGYASILTTRPKGGVLPHFLTDLGQITAGFLLDYGAWRDIERQRNGVCRMPVLTMNYGFEQWYLEQLPETVQQEAVSLILDQWTATAALTDNPLLRQYYIPMGYRVPTALTYGLPAMVYVLELRSGSKVHPTLRKAMLGVVKDFRTVFGDCVALHVDETPDAWDVRRGAQVIEKREHARKPGPGHTVEPLPAEPPSAT